MKTTLISRQKIANPRRTTLAHLADATGLAPAQLRVESVKAEAALPQRTANPRRTVLTELPPAPAAS